MVELELPTSICSKQETGVLSCNVEAGRVLFAHAELRRPCGSFDISVSFQLLLELKCQEFASTGDAMLAAGRCHTGGSCVCDFQPSPILSRPVRRIIVAEFNNSDNLGTHFSLRNTNDNVDANRTTTNHGSYLVGIGIGIGIFHENEKNHVLLQDSLSFANSSRCLR